MKIIKKQINMSDKIKILLYSDAETKAKAIKQSKKLFGKQNISKYVKYLIENDK